MVLQGAEKSYTCEHESRVYSYGGWCERRSVFGRIVEFLRADREAEAIRVSKEYDGANDVAENPIGASGSTHIDIRHPLIKEEGHKQRILVEHLWRDEELANDLTIEVMLRWEALFGPNPVSFRGSSGFSMHRTVDQGTPVRNFILDIPSTSED